MSTLRRHAFIACLALCACLVAGSAAALTWVRVDDDLLVRQSLLVVEATAGDTWPAYDARIPSTDQRMVVQRVITGDFAGDELTVRWRGGLTAGGDLLVLPGIEPAATGARTLLFLGAGDEGTWAVKHMVQGLFRIAEHEGESYAYRAVGGGTQMSIDGKILSVAGDRVAGEIERSRHLESFVRWIRGVAAGEAPTADYWRDVPVDVLRQQAGGQGLEKFRFFTNPFRWREFDGTTNVSLRAHEMGQPLVDGGGFDEFRGAINSWNGDAGSNVLYRYAGKTTARGGFDHPDGVNAILFDDLDSTGGFDDDFRCPGGGTLAVGGGYPGNRVSHTHQGQGFRTMFEADIVTNKGAGCYLRRAGAAEEVFGHELGHTLGLSHSCGDDNSPNCSTDATLDDALMRATAHGDNRGARLNADDRAGIAFLYPAVASTAPAAPTGLSAAVGAGGFVNLSWNDNADNESRFSIERRIDNLGESFAEIASAGRNSTSFQDQTAPTGSTVSYRMRAFNSVGGSDFTNVATVGTPGPTPPSALVAFALPPASIALEWIDNTPAETGFEIQFRRLPGAFQFGLVAETGAGVTTHVFDELFVDTTFEFRVRALTAAGPSSWSQPASATTPPFDPQPCVTTAGTLCLNDSRFQNRVIWRTTDGKAGFGQRVDYEETTDSGLFFFFGEDNWEILIKNLAGCGINNNYWVFSAATTDVEYTVQVVDTFTGATASYFNQSGSAAPAVVDIDAFVDACAVIEPAWAAQPDTGSATAPVAATVAAKADNCPANSETLLLEEGRFEVNVDWRKFDGVQGTGKAVSFCTDDSGLFWFFGADNWELLVKILDACSFNDRFWVFSAATTNVEYTLTVTDTETDDTWQYFNELGQTAVAVTDTDAFATCGD